MTEETMARPEITRKLASLLEKYIAPGGDPRIYWAKEVTFDYSSNHRIRVDYMLFKPANGSVSGIEKGDFFCYEIKSSVEDFHSKNGHNFLGDYNYYVMPATVYDAVKNEIPWSIGVLVPEVFVKRRWKQAALADELNESSAKLASIKKAQRTNRTRPLAEMLLMMFRSCARDRSRPLEEDVWRETIGKWEEP